ncbi:jg16348 [Pararge aegeria aegeria]|uniref:Jg16348 protein n=1 Tax=Pararge aegeria aegeria TaxID=348720 RepID=A0A8S4RUQ8_9NEOP|nr:jg16348 [Pararge aegeria aegeria]
MKLSAIFILVMAVIALFAVQSQADPKVSIKTIKKVGKIAKKGFGVATAVGTAHKIYNKLKNKKPKGG